VEQTREEVGGLKVSVVTTEVSVPDTETGIPVYSGVYRLHRSVTEGRPAGFGAGDQV